MDVDRLVFEWAERALKIPTGSVTSVEISTEEEGYHCCSSYCSAVALVTYSVPLTGRQKKPRFKDTYIYIGGQNLSSLIREVIESEIGKNEKSL